LFGFGATHEARDLVDEIGALRRVGARLERPEEFDRGLDVARASA
jgi:hypothetical protein